MLKGKKIVLGVTGGIAAYKAAEFVRLLVKEEAEVHVVMTQNAQKFVTALTFQTLSGNPVVNDPFTLLEDVQIGHIALADLAELVVVLPATANIIGKIANGIADDFLSTMVMATRSPVLIVPSMNVNMWENPALQKNIQTLLERGYRLMEPGEGELACHWYGKGRLPELNEVVEKMEDLLTPKDLKGEKILITGGPTQEPMDPVRFITNRSSGKMGYALAKIARRRGAEVVLISGPTSLSLARGDIQFVPVRTAEEMKKAVFAHLEGASVVIKAAAVTDYRPKVVSEKKIKKGESEYSLALEKTKDILAELGKKKEDRILIGFAAETEDLVAHAKKKMEEKNLDFIVANDVTQPGAGFVSDTNQVKILYPSGQVKDLPLMTKEETAGAILDQVVVLLKTKEGSRKK
ncbi:MAG TPA: bifunctional phosphopantothenoylcysteine decarboxylase/phosphopantothenate--cysteine ligase CoaBC [Thermodesulfobacteriota bacterium]|nr:bifunctional phosphopantothenoylcysteine decarboxylase/phosphopantothenate--cysteine ligase CoaBC [Thermodesulfobacteriota bacterium]